MRTKLSPLSTPAGMPTTILHNIDEVLAGTDCRRWSARLAGGNGRYVALASGTGTVTLVAPPDWLVGPPPAGAVIGVPSRPSSS